MSILAATNTNISSGGGTSLYDDPLILPAGTASYNVPAGTFLQKILAIEATAINLSIGTTLAGTEIVNAAPVSGSGALALDYYFPAATTIYFTGGTVNTILKLYRR